MFQMSPQKLREWVAAAQPNARLIYAEGGVLADCCPADVCELVMELYDRGWLTPHRQPRRGALPGACFLVQRTQRPYLKGSKL